MFSWINRFIEPLTRNEEFILSIEGGNISQTIALLKQGADINARNTKGDSALCIATYNGNLKAMSLLLGQKGIDVNYVGHNGFRPLHFAVKSGNKYAVLLLLSHQVDVLAPNSYGLSPIDLSESEEIKGILRQHQLKNVSWLQSASTPKTSNLKPDQRNSNGAKSSLFSSDSNNSNMMIKEGKMTATTTTTAPKKMAPTTSPPITNSVNTSQEDSQNNLRYGFKVLHSESSDSTTTAPLTTNSSNTSQEELRKTLRYGYKGSQKPSLESIPLDSENKIVDSTSSMNQRESISSESSELNGTEGESGSALITEIALPTSTERETDTTPPIGQSPFNPSALLFEDGELLEPTIEDFSQIQLFVEQAETRTAKDEELRQQQQQQQELKERKQYEEVEQTERKQLGEHDRNEYTQSHTNTEEANNPTMNDSSMQNNHANNSDNENYTTSESSNEQLPKQSVSTISKTSQKFNDLESTKSMETTHQLKQNKEYEQQNGESSMKNIMSEISNSNSVGVATPWPTSKSQPTKMATQAPKKENRGFASFFKNVASSFNEAIQEVQGALEEDMQDIKKDRINSNTHTPDDINGNTTRPKRIRLNEESSNDLKTKKTASSSNMPVTPVDNVEVRVSGMVLSSHAIPSLEASEKLGSLTENFAFRKYGVISFL
eukprot:TRINITY_DN11962_c0_g1_i3.p1 TRINITY_DN11962_c0_g1~~TRINITY_DN11962_c0_g1_i3.p1  ORF type:complete len:662 (+),score=174.47 TRINITY_DN11962_c0_g1_i3:255-2240(+)